MEKVLDEVPGVRTVQQVDTYDDLLTRRLPSDVVVVGSLSGRPSQLTVLAEQITGGPLVRSLGILLITEPGDHEAAARAGGSASQIGVIPLHSSPIEFASAIHMLAAGYTFGASSDGLSDPGDARLGPNGSPLRNITARETDVLRLLASGLTNLEMARDLCLTESTVKFHVQSLLRKLNLRNRASLVAFAYETGLVLVGGWLAERTH